MKIFILSLLTITSICVMGQIEVRKIPKDIKIGEARQGGLFNSSLSYFVEDGFDTVYHIMFRDNQYNHITQYEHINFRGNIDELYNLFYSRLLYDEDESVAAKIGDRELLIVTKKLMGTKFIYIFKGSSYFVLSERTLNKLFNKNQPKPYDD